jgi:hypothetical protein
VISNISQATKDILAELSKPVPGVQPTSNSILLEEMEQGFRQWRKSTSMSTLGRHLGHYQALLTYRHLDKTEHEKVSRSIP